MIDLNPLMVEAAAGMYRSGTPGHLIEQGTGLTLDQIKALVVEHGWRRPPNFRRTVPQTFRASGSDIRAAEMLLKRVAWEEFDLSQAGSV